MKRMFGVKKEINKRGDVLDEKIRKLEAELVKYRDQIKRTRPGPPQEAIKARAMRVLKQKKMLEGQRDNLYNQTFNLEQVSFAHSGLKDAQQTMAAMKTANKELKQTYKTMKIEDVESLQDDMMDLMDYSTEIQDAMGRSYGVPDDIDEGDLMGELDALEMDMGEEAGESVPSYLAPEREPDALSEGGGDPFASLPAAPTGRPAQPTTERPQVDEFGFPNAPTEGVRT
ncbi:SNF7 family protein [Klebsormidium nitens]|uniref:SNF7 family protein n=1 Tax=Klebsormidium nitens TaxID=105231 RepID=A0A1Y1I0J7_KLENI|nr:SNF7 family protein [Klebsormidium nitens]|eukprot:GAQ81628.1 SNF7 family protein [Klebsormidium nitens]